MPLASRESKRRHQAPQPSFSILHYFQETGSPITALCKIMENAAWKMLLAQRV
jgi:hypothetical protein